MEKLNKLKSFAELAEQLEDNGYFVEANIVHNQFIKLAAEGPMGVMPEDPMGVMPEDPMGKMPEDAEATAPDLDLGPKTQFSVMIKQNAPKFIQLLAYAPRHGAPTFNIDVADANTVGLIQSMLGVKTDKNSRGNVGNATLTAISNNQSGLDRMLFNKFSRMYNLQAKDNKTPLTIDLWKK
jgi:hypothetical protein